MTQPTTPAMPLYRQQAAGDDDRLVAPTFLRNNPPMIATLTPWLGVRKGTVLEVGAGTGQHAAAFSLAFPNLVWRASDPDEPHRASTRAWARFLRAPQHAPIDLDASADWDSHDDVRELGPLTAVISMNVIHISPPAVMRGIFQGAGEKLTSDGLLIFYGPFREFGEHSGPGNAKFDNELRAKDPQWGLRDIAELDALGAQNGLQRTTLVPMPANNRIVIYERG